MTAALELVVYCASCSRPCTRGGSGNRNPGQPHIEAHGRCGACCARLRRHGHTDGERRVGVKGPAFGALDWGREDAEDGAACGRADRTAFEAPDKPTGGHIPQRAVNAARRYCAMCPVIDACADYASRHREAGLWGGQWRSANGAVRDIRTKTTGRR